MLVIGTTFVMVTPWNETEPPTPTFRLKVSPGEVAFVSVETVVPGPGDPLPNRLAAPPKSGCPGDKAPVELLIPVFSPTDPRFTIVTPKLTDPVKKPVVTPGARLGCSVVVVKEIGVFPVKYPNCKPTPFNVPET